MAVGDETAVKAYGGTLGTTAETVVATVAASRKLIVTSVVIVCRVAANVSLRGPGAGPYWANPQAMAAGDLIQLTGQVAVLAAAETIRAWASVGSAIDVMISAVEEEV